MEQPGSVTNDWQEIPACLLAEVVDRVLEWLPGYVTKSELGHRWRLRRWT